ncbi:prolyl-tRNA synthetase associated domain-containing protein [Caproiciproducens sp. NJN-50]|uniref:prolyl-tRNA synthetase associated domain-containing protein n=1 Tax=Acutalibacteraceae TaxID=3082771 RepID=UPI000FFE0CD2|nr:MULTISPECIES: prolyl-tRNA synthetase associated domain-containing protein [Acutalibacteraceae]QAT48664.1 prolyl-tRNA synthetase associated domain-containing protein [Caproiciproducens sp. NJN-50]
MSDIHIDPRVYHEKPANVRLPKEMAVYELLDRLEIPYARLDHDAVGHVESCGEIGRILGVEICKNLFLCNRQKTEFYLLMMPGRKEFHTKVLSQQTGSSRLSFAGEEFMQEYLNVTPGSVSVMGLMNDRENRVRLLMDRDVAESEFIGCHPCINTSSLKIKTKDLFIKFFPFSGHEPTIVTL